MNGRINFDKNWKFYLGDLAPQRSTDGWGGAKSRAFFFGAAAFDANDEKWRTVDLPHDFVSEGDYTQKTAEKSEMTDIPEMESIDSRHFAGGSLEGGVAWYRKHFDIPAQKSNERVYIYFDGIYRDSTIYLNDYYVGSNASGYTGFYYDITDFVNYGGENVIAVRVDSRGREGWWYEGGGIYRHVWLEYRSKLAVEPYGIFVNATPDLQKKTAKIEISADIGNYNTECKTLSVKTEIQASDGGAVGGAEGCVNVNAYDTAHFESCIEADGITLWDIDNPYLYKAVVRVYDGAILCDEQTVTFGIREMRFDADTGFYMNGRNIKIKGVCLHHDHAGVGIGISDSVNEYRIRQVMGMGANAIRISHYPASPVLLDICDRLGVLVFEEQRRMSSAPEDLGNLRAMVKRDRNHPSIFLWGIGNEEIFAQDRPEMERATVTMKMAVKKLDPTRPVTSAVVCWNGKERFDTAESYVPVTSNLDVMGFNYCKTAWDDYHERKPSQPVIVTEEATSSMTRGAFETDESRGIYFIYDKDNLTKCKNGAKAARTPESMGEATWKYCEERPYISGIFLWTGIDYRGEPTPLSYPAVYTQFGICDYCGFPKDNYYYYKAVWTEEPVLHIFPHWNHSEGDVVNVYGYSNLDEAELFVNGRSCGRKKIERNMYLTWENVVYEKGEISAKGYKDGEEVLCDIVRTTGKPEKIVAEPYFKTVKADDTAIINIRITDGDGLTVPTADNELSFTVEGDGVLQGTGNGNPADHSSEKLPVRRAFNGLCQLLVRAVDEGEIRITVKAQGMKDAFIRVSVLK